MTSKDTIHKILQNSLVLENICQNLTFSDQLKLMHVCEEFRSILVNIVWRSMCKALIVTERSSENYLLQLNGSDYYLKKRIFFAFIKLNRLNVKKAQLRQCDSIDSLMAVNQLEHLSSLELQFCRISNSNMEVIAINCLELRILIFDRCIQSNNSTEIVLGRDIKVKTLSKCYKLKELCLYNRYKVKMNYEAMHEILKELCLSKLIINSTILYEGSDKINNDAVKDSVESFKCMNNLSIGRFSNRGSWTNFIKMHLSQFCNLKTLSIFIDLANCVLINDDVLITICNSCPCLCELSFKQCKFQVQYFVLTSELRQLSLEWCWGITWQNLKQILNEHQLYSFISINGHYNGDDGNLFYNASTLQTFTLETSLIKDIVDILRTGKSYFPNVSTLNWLNSSESCHTYPHEIRQNLTVIFPKLQELHLVQSYLNSKELQQMPYLKILQFSLFDHMLWSYLLNLLESTSLTHLTIDMPTNVTSTVCSILHSKPQAINKLELTNSLQFLKIPLEIFQNGLSFWFKFLQRNYNLKLMFYNNYSYKMLEPNFLVNLINSENFPQNVKSINICNRIVDCNALRKDAPKTMNSFQFVCNSKGQYFIIL